MVMNFLANNNVTALERCSNYPDVAAADYYLFSRLKSKLKGLCCCDATDTFKNWTEDLKIL
jgi:hypothetical protein